MLSPARRIKVARAGCCLQSIRTVASSPLVWCGCAGNKRGNSPFVHKRRQRRSTLAIRFGRQAVVTPPFARGSSKQVETVQQVLARQQYQPPVPSKKHNDTRAPQHTQRHSPKTVAVKPPASSVRPTHTRQRQASVPGSASTRRASSNTSSQHATQTPTAADPRRVPHEPSAPPPSPASYAHSQQWSEGVGEAGGWWDDGLLQGAARRSLQSSVSALARAAQSLASLPHAYRSRRESRVPSSGMGVLEEQSEQGRARASSPSAPPRHRSRRMDRSRGHAVRMTGRFRVLHVEGGFHSCAWCWRWQIVGKGSSEIPPSLIPPEQGVHETSVLLPQSDQRRYTSTFNRTWGQWRVC